MEVVRPIHMSLTLASGLGNGAGLHLVTTLMAIMIIIRTCLQKTAQQMPLLTIHTLPKERMQSLVPNSSKNQEVTFKRLQ